MSVISAWAIAASDQDFGQMGKQVDGRNASLSLRLCKCFYMLEHRTLPIDSPRFHVFSFAVTEHSARCPSIAAPQVLYTPQLPRTAPCSRCHTLQNAKQSELLACLVPAASKISGFNKTVEIFLSKNLQSPTVVTNPWGHLNTIGAT